MAFTWRRLTQSGWALLVVACSDSEPKLEDVDYVTVAANGGECALFDDITMVTSDTDGFFVHTLTLIAPSTVSIQYKHHDPTHNYSCTLRAPSCATPALPDFSDVRALLSHPDVVTLIEGGEQWFVPEWRAGETLTVADFTFPEHACVGSDRTQCMPPAAVELQALVKTFEDLHTCDSQQE